MLLASSGKINQHGHGQSFLRPWRGIFPCSSPSCPSPSPHFPGNFFPFYPGLILFADFFQSFLHFFFCQVFVSLPHFSGQEHPKNVQINTFSLALNLHPSSKDSLCHHHREESFIFRILGMNSLKNGGKMIRMG